MLSSLGLSAFIISVVSSLIAIGALWTSREKLRLELYNRRFDLYVKALELYQALERWKPTDEERRTGLFKDSPQLVTAQGAFIKASRESQFLFPADSGIPKLFDELHKDSIGIVGYLMDLAYLPNAIPQALPPYQDFLERRNRMNKAFPELEKKMAPYLNFHRL